MYIMKPFFLISSFCCFLLIMTASCNKETENKAINAFAEQFVKQLNSGDATSVKKAYPNAAEVDSFTRGFVETDIQISRDRMTNGYCVSLGEGNWFVVVGKDASSFRIIKSHGLFAFDNKMINLAEKTGWIAPKMNDKQIAEALSDTAFIDFMTDKALASLQKYVLTSNEESLGNSFDINVKVTIHNKTSKTLYGSDYKIKVFSTWMGGEDEKKFIAGRDVNGNDSISTTTSLLMNGSGGTGFYSEVILLTDKLSKKEIIEKYYVPDINDYKEYLKTKIQ